MSKRDYEQIARAIATARYVAPFPHTPAATTASHQAFTAVVETLARSLKASNPRFDIARFTAACGQLRT